MRCRLIGRPFLAISVALLGAACSTESIEPSGTGGSGGSTGVTGGGGTDNGTATAGGSRSGGSGGVATGTGGVSNTAGGGMTNTAGGGMANTAGGMANGGSGGAGGDPVDYKCSRVVGPSQALEWYQYDYNTSYFETLVPNDKWELKAASGAQLNKWSDSSSGIWSDVKDSDASEAIPIYSPCAGNTPPDRIVAYFVCYQYKTREEWDTGLKNFITNIKSKYPTVTRIELFTGNRCSLNTCPQTADVTPPTNTCRIFPMIDEAMAAAAAANPGFVVVGPKFEHLVCGDFVDPVSSGHLKKGPAQGEIAKKYADYFNSL